MTLPTGTTSLMVLSTGEFTSRLLQTAAFAAGYRWPAFRGSDYRNTDAPALVFYLLEREIRYSSTPSFARSIDNRVELTVGQALAFFRSDGRPDKSVDCTIPEE